MSEMPECPNAGMPECPKTEEGTPPKPVASAATFGHSGIRAFRHWLWISALVVAAIPVLLFLRPREASRTFSEEVRADRGPVPLVLRELGVLAPRDPVVARSPFTARIQWIAEDGTWVDKGADLFILSDEDEIKRVAELRTQLVQARAELKLAVMRRQHGEDTEKPKLAAAERAFALAEQKRRLVDARPKGGLELVRIAEALRPLAQKTDAARTAAEAAQDTWQHALDAYLAALDTWQGNRDGIMRLQAKVDELEAGGGSQEDAAAKEAREKRLVEAREKLTAERGRTQDLATALAASRAERDRQQPERDRTTAALAEAELAERDLRFAAEVEKRGLPLAKLQLDERQGGLDVAATRRQLEQTRTAVEAGSLARSELERLEDQLKRQENDFAVVKARIAIESRPPDAKTIAEADAQLEQARTAAEDAKAAYGRAIALLDQDLAMRQAQADRLAAQIEQRSAGFPAVLEGGIRFAERELAMLGPDEAEAKAEAEKGLADLRARYEVAKGAPPNVVKAPVSGLVKVTRGGDRIRQAGDQAWEADALVEVHPPANMDVLLRVNEVDVRLLKPGMKARVTVPALKERGFDGEVVQVASVGRDKFQRPEYNDPHAFADVVDFEARVRLSGTEGVGLRQGMAARVEILQGERADVLRLPLAALRRNKDGWEVTAADGRVRAVKGAAVGPLWFAIESGIAAGETVRIERTRNR